MRQEEVEQVLAAQYFYELKRLCLVGILLML